MYVCVSTLVGRNPGLYAAARSGVDEVATEAFHWIAEMTGASRTRWALGLEARSRALVSGPDAEPHFREAIDLLGGTRVRTELARAQCGTIRLKLFKVGAIIIRNTRRVIFHFSSAYPWKSLFLLDAHRLARE